MQIFPTRMCNVTAWRHSRLRAHWLMTLVGGGGAEGEAMYSAFPGNWSVSYLPFVYGRSLWAELNGGKNSLHWKANMLPLFSIMTLWFQRTKIWEFSYQIEIICTRLKGTERLVYQHWNSIPVQDTHNAPKNILTYCTQ